MSELVEFYLKELLSNGQGEIVWRKYKDKRSPYYLSPHLASKVWEHEEIKPMGCRCDYCGSFSGTGHTNCKNCGAPLNPKFLVV